MLLNKCPLTNELLNKVATRHLCLIDKTIGDEVMLVMPCFGPELKSELAGYQWPERRNPLPSLAQFLVDLVHDLNAALPDLAFSSGFAFGRVLLTTVGTEVHSEKTVYGNCVNAAKRLQSHPSPTGSGWRSLLKYFKPGTEPQYRVAIGAMRSDREPFLTELRGWVRESPLAQELSLLGAIFRCKRFKGVGELCYLTAGVSTGTARRPQGREDQPSLPCQK